MQVKKFRRFKQLKISETGFLNNSRSFLLMLFAVEKSFLPCDCKEDDGKDETLNDKREGGKEKLWATQHKKWISFISLLLFTFFLPSPTHSVSLRAELYLIKNFMGRWFIVHHTAWRHQIASILSRYAYLLYIVGLFLFLCCRDIASLYEIAYFFLLQRYLFIARWCSFLRCCLLLLLRLLFVKWKDSSKANFISNHVT